MQNRRSKNRPAKSLRLDADDLDVDLGLFAGLIDLLTDLDRLLVRHVRLALDDAAMLVLVLTMKNWFWAAPAKLTIRAPASR